MAASKSRKIKWGIALIVWPVAALVLAVALFALVNWILDGGNGSSVFSTIMNVVLFILGALAVGLGLPSAIVGIVLIATAGSSAAATSQGVQEPQMIQATQATHVQPVATPTTQEGKGMSIAGMILGIASIVLFWFFGFILGVMAIIFSSIGLKRKNAKGLAVTGLVTGIIGTILSVIAGIGFIAAISYAGIQERASDSAIQADASIVEKHSEIFYAENGRYPDLAEIREQVEWADADLVIGSQGSESSEDVIYIPCYGDGAIIWRWDAASEEYVTVELGATESCEWND